MLLLILKLAISLFCRSLLESVLKETLNVSLEEGFISQLFILSKWLLLITSIVWYLKNEKKEKEEAKKRNKFVMNKLELLERRSEIIMEHLIYLQTTTTTLHYGKQTNDMIVDMNKIQNIQRIKTKKYHNGGCSSCLEKLHQNVRKRGKDSHPINTLPKHSYMN